MFVPAGGPGAPLFVPAENPGLLPCCSGSASRVSGLSLVSPSPQLPRGLAQPFPGSGNGYFAGSGDAGGSAAAGCHCRRAGPCAGQGGTGAAHPLGNPEGKRIFLMAEVTLSGF